MLASTEIGFFQELVDASIFLAGRWQDVLAPQLDIRGSLDRLRLRLTQAQTQTQVCLTSDSDSDSDSDLFNFISYLASITCAMPTPLSACV
jgi:hypothetical protein